MSHHPSPRVWTLEAVRRLGTATNVQAALQRTLGASAFDSAHGEGERLSPTEALRLAPFDESDNSGATSPVTA
jgi:hypothetical protein